MRSRRRLIAMLPALAAGLVLASVAGAASRTASLAGQAGSGLDSATLTSCTTGATTAQRSATFSAEMAALPGSRIMSVSFELFERTSATSPYVAVTAPGFGVWQSSKRGIASFTANENVVDLPAPASFRAVVHYRWLSRHGRVIHSDERVTPACVEAVAEPDLLIPRITHALGSPKTTELYKIFVRNSGALAAGPFAVAFSVGQTALPDQTIASLAPATTTALLFTGPRCTPGTTITAQVDPAGAITEPANADRAVTMTCGSAGVSPTS